MALVTLSRLCPIGLCVHVVGRCLVTLSRLCPIGLCVHKTKSVKCINQIVSLVKTKSVKRINQFVSLVKTKSVDINFLSLINSRIDLT